MYTDEPCATHGHDGLVNTACRISCDTLTQVLQSIRVCHSRWIWFSFVPCLSSSSFSSSCSRSPPPLLLNMPPGISRSCCPGRRYSGDGNMMEGGLCTHVLSLWCEKIFPMRADTHGNFPPSFLMTHIFCRSTYIKQPYRFYIGLEWI